MIEPRDERRRLPRRRTLKGARIIFNERHSVINCVVRNLSPHGALLRLPNIIGVPDVFDVYIDGDPACRRAQVVWKGSGSLGVTWT